MHVRELIPGMSFQQLTATYQDILKDGTQGAPGDKYALMKERVILLGTCDSDMVEVVGQSDTSQKEDNDDEVGGQSDTTQKEDIIHCPGCQQWWRPRGSRSSLALLYWSARPLRQRRQPNRAAKQAL